MKKRILILSLTCGCISIAFGQSPQSLRQFYFNPYQFNPAYTGSASYTEIYFAYRKQWAAFNDAPETFSLNLQHATARNVSLGANIATQEAVGLRSTSVLATFAYLVPLRENESLRFGLSAGVGSNKLSFNDGEFNPNDPTVTKALVNNFYADGNFGILYTYSKLKIGFALPRLIGQAGISPQSLGGNDLSQLKNHFYSISYSFPLSGGNFAIDPYFIFRENKDGQNYWEAATTVTYRSLLWLGASYHQTSGLGFWAGFSIKEYFRISYSYELPPPGSDFISTNSSELQLNVRLQSQRVAGRRSEFNPMRPRNERGIYKPRYR